MSLRSLLRTVAAAAVALTAVSRCPLALSRLAMHGVATASRAAAQAKPANVASVPRATAAATPFHAVTVETTPVFTPPSAAVSPARLASTWPSLIGQRVAFDGATVERAIDVTEFVVVADDFRFAVLMAPDQVWTGRSRRTFVVAGSTRVPLHGRTVLPELVLDEGGCEP